MNFGSKFLARHAHHLLCADHIASDFTCVVFIALLLEPFLESQMYMDSVLLIFLLVSLNSPKQMKLLIELNYNALHRSMNAGRNIYFFTSLFFKSYIFLPVLVFHYRMVEGGTSHFVITKQFLFIFLRSYDESESPIT